MRSALIADIHANLAAFNAVLDDARRRGGVDEIWCMGDVVGYGPEPNQCLELLRRHQHICVAGNHDLAAIGRIDTSDFNPDAAAAAVWTGRQLTPENVDYLAGLPLRVERESFTVVHGSPRQPVWEYVLSADGARDNFRYFNSRFCLIGHSHVPLVFREEAGDVSLARLLPDTRLVLGEERLIINPGGVGQPRDGDPRASYAIYDSEAGIIILYRVPYDIGATQARMREYGLPPRLIARLSYGI